MADAIPHTRQRRRAHVGDAPGLVAVPDPRRTQTYDQEGEKRLIR